MSDAEQLAQGLAEVGLTVSADVQTKLLAYLALITKWNRVHNLTAIRDSSKMVSGHVLDSLATVRYLRTGSVLDVGSGAGLPGIPLALARPQSRVTLLDSNHKKTAFLRQAVIELGLDNVDVVGERVEHWEPGRRFDVVISRAFSDIADLVKVAGRLCAPDGTLAAMKGVYPYEEIAQLPVDFKLREVIPLQVPGLRAQRHLVVLEPARVAA